jgi:diguanylate cyclase (GGDEF)-like protein
MTGNHPGERRRDGLGLVPMAATIAVLAYVLLLLLVTFVAQRNLRESVVEQQRHALEKTASAFGYFFDERRRDLERLREDRTLEGFFANRALGMSMEYGLQASLRNVERSLARFADATRINGWPVFRRLVLLDAAHQPLADTAPELGPVTLRLSADGAASKSVEVVVEHARGEAIVSLQALHEHKGWTAGYLVAWVDQDTAFDELARHADVPVSGAIELLDADGRWVAGIDRRAERDAMPAEVVAAAELAQSPPAGERDDAALRAPVPGAPFELVAPSPRTNDYLTSGWLTFSLGLLALLVLAAAAATQRARTQNLLLEARVEEAKRQEEGLSQKNARLEEEMRMRVQYEEQLLRQANYDQLTGLPNRTLAIDRLNQAIARGQRAGSHVAVLYLDLDRFKNVNDTLGHSAGDELLINAARRLAGVARGGDTVARLSGDEFLVIVADIEPGSSAEKAAERVAESVLRSFSEPFTVAGQEFFVSISVGIAVFPEDGQRAERLLQHADTALYQAKEEGRHAFRFFTPDMNRRAQQRAGIEGHLIHAIERNELSLVYQPIVSLRTGRPVALEALVRWSCPSLGVVPPSLFIPLAEETGLIQDIGEWVLEQAIAGLAAWHAEPSLRIAVNVSSRQLRNPKRFLRAVEVALYRNGLSPTQLELELTERLLLEELPETSRALRELDEAGVRLSVDDFGTGYSSLGYLKRFPVDVLKIDRSFVSGVLKDGNDAALVRAILAMAHALRLDVVAEGVEAEAQAEFLHANGCACAQGYWFSMPLPATDVPQYLAATALPERRTA